jgi:toxin ParE1/3/4
VPKFRIARQAYADVDEIAAFIQRDNPVRAQSFTDELSHRIGQCVERPLSFPARDDLAPGLRVALHGNYLILFRIEDGVVHVIRVLHGGRDIPNLL